MNNKALNFIWSDWIAAPYDEFPKRYEDVNPDISYTITIDTAEDDDRWSNRIYKHTNHAVQFGTLVFDYLNINIKYYKVNHDFSISFKDNSEMSWRYIKDYDSILSILILLDTLNLTPDNQEVITIINKLKYYMAGV